MKRVTGKTALALVWLLGGLAACMPAVPPGPPTPSPADRPGPGLSPPTAPPPVLASPLPPAGDNRLWSAVGSDVLALVGRMAALNRTAAPLYSAVRVYGRPSGSDTPATVAPGYTASQEQGRTVWTQTQPVTEAGGLSGQAVSRYVAGAMGDDYTYAASLIGANGRQLTLRWRASFYIDYSTSGWLVDEVLSTGRTRRLVMTGGSSFAAQSDKSMGTIEVGGRTLTAEETGAFGQPDRTFTIGDGAGLTAVARFQRGQPITGFDVTEGGQSYGRVLIPAPSDW
jgi:hypothetical protein